MPAKDRTKRRLAPRQDRAQASVEAILEAAKQLLRERGFAGTTTNHIAARAGVNVALLYRYFAGKEAIVGALIEATAKATGARIAATLEAHQQSPMPIGVRAILQAMMDVPGDPDLHRELAEHVDITRQQEMLQAVITQSTVLFAQYLIRRKNELRPELDLEATLFVLQHAFNKATEAAVFYRPKALSLTRVLDAQTDLIVRCLMPVQDDVKETTRRKTATPALPKKRAKRNSDAPELNQTGAAPGKTSVRSKSAK